MHAVGWVSLDSTSQGAFQSRFLNEDEWVGRLTLHSDPGAPDEAAAKGMISLSFGKLFEKVWNDWHACIGQAADII